MERGIRGEDYNITIRDNTDEGFSSDEESTPCCGGKIKAYEMVLLVVIIILITLFSALCCLVCG